MTVSSKPVAGAGMLARPEGKEVMGASTVPPNALEQAALIGLDADKLNHLAECLFVLNNRRYGPIPGSYIVVCIRPGQAWCVGQLNADRLRPFLLFEDWVFASAEQAVAAAEQMKLASGESAPRRSI